jgi:hypothetical protein
LSRRRRPNIKRQAQVGCEKGVHSKSAHSLRIILIVEVCKKKLDKSRAVRDKSLTSIRHGGLSSPERSDKVLDESPTLTRRSATNAERQSFANRSSVL